MSELRTTQAQFLDLLLEKHLAGKLTWKPREGEDSFETDIGTHTIHLDRKPVGTAPNYKVWVFDNATGDDILSFDTKNMSEYAPKNDAYESYFKVVSFIYRDVKDAATLEQLSGVIDELKAI